MFQQNWAMGSTVDATMTNPKTGFNTFSNCSTIDATFGWSDLTSVEDNSGTDTWDLTMNIEDSLGGRCTSIRYSQVELSKWSNHSI